jgi:hypothetical protein
MGCTDLKGGNMTRPGRGALLLLATVVGTAVVGLSALGASASADERLYIGINLHFTGPDTTAGTFVMSGEIGDAGTSHVENLSLVPIAGTDMARLSGDQTYVGGNGTIVTHFEGRAFPLSSPHQVGRGRIEIVSGTGAYAGLKGHAKFLIVVDAGSNQLIGNAAGSIAGHD